MADMEATKVKAPNTFSDVVQTLGTLSQMARPAYASLEPAAYAGRSTAFSAPPTSARLPDAPPPAPANSKPTAPSSSRAWGDSEAEAAGMYLPKGRIFD